MLREVRLLVLLVVLGIAPACATAAERNSTVVTPEPTPSPSPTVSPLPQPTLNPVEPPADGEPAVLLPSGSAPPIWPLSTKETDRIMGGVASRYVPAFSHDYAPIRQRCGDIERGPLGLRDLVADNAEVEACLRPYLEELGVDAEALDLFFASGIAIWRAEPTGPFWLAEGFDYDMYGSNGSPPDYLFTPEGIFDVPGQFTSFFPPEGWTPLMDALEVAQSAEPMPAIRDAFAEVFGGKPKDIGFQAYGELIDLHPARETATGWAVPFTWLLIGCHACDTPIVGRFQLDADADGVIFGVRFVDLCYDPTYIPNDPSDVPGGDDRFGLPYCGA